LGAKLNVFLDKPKNKLLCCFKYCRSNVRGQYHPSQFPAIVAE